MKRNFNSTYEKYIEVEIKRKEHNQIKNKICKDCNIEKEVTSFRKQKSEKDGLQSICKSCGKEYRTKNKEHKNEYSRKYYQKNKEKRIIYKEKSKEHRIIYKEKSKEHVKEQRKKYYKENKERLKTYSKKYKKDNAKKIKEYYDKRIEKRREKRRIYKENNKELIDSIRKENDRKSKRNYQKKRRAKDPLFKLSGNLRNRTAMAFRSNGYSKKSKTQEMLGADYESVFNHLQKQFTKGMNWINYGEWHIDHIIPLSLGKTEEELIKLCHYSNLQPLWAFDNLSKSDKIIGQQNKLRI